MKWDAGGFPSGSTEKNLPAILEDMGSTPDPGGFYMPRGS